MRSVESADQALLRDALALGPETPLRQFSREPLGAGSVTGFEVHHDDVDLVYYVDTSRRSVAVETGLVTGEGSAPEARVWLHPSDPHLPALAPLAFSHAAEALLARLGIRAEGAPAIVGYRPGRRAVLRVATDGGDVWLKAVPPSRAADLARTHEALHAAGIPVPELLGWSDQGVLVSASAPGAPVAEALGDPAHRLDSALLLDGVDRLRDAFAGVPLTLPSRTHLRRRLGWYVERLIETEAAPDAQVLREVHDRALARWGADQRAVIHGDLHFGQLFADDEGRVTGVIDVDTAGLGHPFDDTGAFVSHAIASAFLTSGEQNAGVWMLASKALARWSSATTGGDGLASRVSTHLLGHALGSYEAGDPARGDGLITAASAVLDDDLDAVIEAVAGEAPTAVVSAESRSRPAGVV